MEHTGATRAELLVTQRQIALAQQGRELLQEKRNALLQQPLPTSSQVLRTPA